jgi:hypothetical protein
MAQHASNRSAIRPSGDTLQPGHLEKRTDPGCAGHRVPSASAGVTMPTPAGNANVCPACNAQFIAAFACGEVSVPPICQIHATESATSASVDFPLIAFVLAFMSLMIAIHTLRF